MFPSDVMRNQYLDTIDTRTDKQVKDLLRNFLITSGSLGADESMVKQLLDSLQRKNGSFERLMEDEFCKRLLKGCLNGKTPPWEGNTWILDLLPDHPKFALDALNAYFLAHIQLLPDGRFAGLEDAMGLIRAKYVQSPKSSLLQSLQPYQFECLIDALYHEMGYSTSLTPKTYNGGRDVIAYKKDPGEREMLLVQCSTSKQKIGVEAARALLGVVSHEKATKGVFVSTSEFTREAKKLEKRNPRLELIGNKDLQQLLNEYFGSNWPKHVDFIISDSMLKMRRARKSN
jgi:restriction system protein